MINIHLTASADEVLGTGIDCSELLIDYTYRPDMTQSERVEAMDKAFFESIDRFELCYLANQSDSESANAGSAGSAGGEGTAGGTEGSESNIESAVSPLMTGTETESNLLAPDSADDLDIPEYSLKEYNLEKHASEGLVSKEEIATYEPMESSKPNGAAPKDIPDVNNDDAVAAQIRLAAELEKEPIKKEKLWNEYRKYIGLPVKKINEKIDK